MTFTLAFDAHRYIICGVCSATQTAVDLNLLMKTNKKFPAKEKEKLFHDSLQLRGKRKYFYSIENVGLSVFHSISNKIIYYLAFVYSSASLASSSPDTARTTRPRKGKEKRICSKFEICSEPALKSVVIIKSCFL